MFHKRPTKIKNKKGKSVKKTVFAKVLDKNLIFAA
jgi:hypothetical protein